MSLFPLHDIPTYIFYGLCTTEKKTKDTLNQNKHVHVHLLRNLNVCVYSILAINMDTM